MLHKIFSVYDSKVEAYLQPFFLNNNATAIRAITDCLSDSSHTFARHPQDYVLFDLGTFNDSSATWELLAAPNSLGVLIEYLPDSAPIELPPPKLKKA